jgi:hypothetical protein
MMHWEAGAFVEPGQLKYQPAHVWDWLMKVCVPSDADPKSVVVQHLRIPQNPDVRQLCLGKRGWDTAILIVVSGYAERIEDRS